jgi:serine/threonine-protein kinase
VNGGAAPPDRWVLVGEIFLEASELSGADRERLLDERCGDDQALRQEVVSLLGAHEDEGLVPDLDEERRFGGRYPERIGRYRIVRPLGEGGMGVVLLAIREGDGFEQTVALKVLRGAFADPLMARRLEEERRILAGLEHPGIARLIDGGLTEDGQPYFAMEYVDGEGLLTYCDQRRLSLPERIELFLGACAAVHYAHQQLVVHRDLKPSNIMVTPEGRPKLLDFGIAKNVEAFGGAEQTTHWITPAYASPEQVAGGTVSTLSDVYALGVLLCELLSGSRPYVTTTGSPAELSRLISETIPRRPSDLALGSGGDASRPDSAPGTGSVSENRRTTPQRLARTLRGDLDLIVLKALAKEPDRRYDSAQALAEDLQRYLGGQPIMARPESTRYRLGKFVRRHRTGVVASALLGLALIGGLGATLWQAQRAADARDQAQEEAARARQVTGLMTEIFRLSDPTQSLGDTVGIRGVLEEGASRVEQTLRDDPVLQATLFLELARIYRNLGILDEADRLSARALLIRRDWSPGTIEHADALGFRGIVLRDEGKIDLAITSLEQAIDLRGQLVPPPDTGLATLQATLAWEVRAAGEYDRAGALFSQALEVQRTVLGNDDPAVANTLLGLASTFHDQGSFDEAEALFRTALEGDGGQANPAAATALVNLGMVRRLREQFPESEALLRSGLEMREALYDADHPDVLEAREQWAAALAAMGRFGEAEATLNRNLDLSISVLGEEHIRTRNSREALSNVDWDLGRFALALARKDSVATAKNRAHGGDHPGTVYTLISMAEVLLEMDDVAAARTKLGEAISMAERLGGTEGVYGALARNVAARIALDAGNVAEADSLVEAAMALAEERLRPDHRYVLEIQRVRARVLLGQARPRDAQAVLEGVLEDERRVRPHPHPRIGITLLDLGDARMALGDAVAAGEAYRAAETEFSQLPQSHPLVGRARDGGAAADARARPPS